MSHFFIDNKLIWTSDKGKEFEESMQCKKLFLIQYHFDFIEQLTNIFFGVVEDAKAYLKSKDVRRLNNPQSIVPNGIAQQRYDAFILAADADSNFAADILEVLGSRGLKVCMNGQWNCSDFIHFETK